MQVDTFSQAYSYASSLSTTLSETQASEAQDKRLEEERAVEEIRETPSVNEGRDKHIDIRV